jgi:hypothetical protein
MQKPKIGNLSKTIRNHTFTKGCLPPTAEIHNHSSKYPNKEKERERENRRASYILEEAPWIRKQQITPHFPGIQTSNEACHTCKNLTKSPPQRVDLSYIIILRLWRNLDDPSQRMHYPTPPNHVCQNSLLEHPSSEMARRVTKTVQNSHTSTTAPQFNPPNSN